MIKEKYLTVPEELLPLAEISEEHYRAKAYTIRVEPTEYLSPYVPAFSAKRKKTVVFVEVLGSCDHHRIEDWSRFCKSAGEDYRICVVLNEAEISARDIKRVKQKKAGILIVSTDGEVEEICHAADQSVVIEPPELGRLPDSIRQRLAEAYEKFEKGEWREGFEECVIFFEQKCRDYLVKHTKTDRIVILKKGVPATPSEERIRTMTLGQLGHAFDNIESRNKLDEKISQTILRINPERIDVTHYKWLVDENVKQNAGRHVWSIIACLKDMEAPEKKSR